MSASFWSLGLGLVLCGTGWMLPRRVSGTPLQWSWALPVDGLVPLLTFGLLASASARPIASGVAVLALCGGYAMADRSKRAVLKEPIVFTDVLQAFDIFRHPRLALPFPNTMGVALLAVCFVLFFSALYMLEKAAWAWSAWPLLGFLVLGAFGAFIVAGPALSAGTSFLRGLGPTASPARDAKVLGPFALLIVYGVVARGERQRRLGWASAESRGGNPPHTLDFGPVVLVQCESFCDARRLHGAIPQDLLPKFEACLRSSIVWGQFAVPSWGANTVRTEAAVLTGLDEERLGLDRFNPYHAMAQISVPALATRFRALGYRTVCVHPFDRAFYGRDRVMPRLGFDEFVGEEAFMGTVRANGYVSDLEVARVVDDILSSYGPKTFLFVITMENHGPWPDRMDPDPAIDEVMSRFPAEERAAFGAYLRGLRSADSMIARLVETLEHAPGDEATLAFYGDHLPSFPKTLASLPLQTCDSDYFIWRKKDRFTLLETPPRRLAAAEMADTLWAALDDRKQSWGLAKEPQLPSRLVS